MKILIIGGSHGGQAAARAILATDPTATVTLVEQQSLAMSTQPRLTCLTATATAVQPEKHQVQVLKAGHSEELTYDKLILAPGASAVLPPIPGSRLDGVMTVRNRADLERVHAIVQDSAIQRIVVVGGGYIGVGMADLFSQHGKQVTLIDHAPRILQTYLDAPMTQQLQAELAQQTVQFKLNAKVIALIGETHVQKVQLEKETVAADLVIFAVGNRPQTQWLPTELVDPETHLIPVDDYFQTPVADVFALGDAVALPYQPLNCQRSIALASNADRAGTLVALNLTKPNCRFNGVVGTSLWQAGKLQFAATGLTHSAALDAGIDTRCVTLTQQRRATGNEQIEIQCQLLYAPTTNKILGVQLLANGALGELINVFAMAVQHQLTLSDLVQADFYMTPGTNNLPNLVNAVAFAGLAQAVKQK